MPATSTRGRHGSRAARRAARAARLALSVLISASPAAAQAPAGSAAPAAAPAAAQAEAKEIYASTCVSCHGPAGAGDGLAAAGLPAKPASFAAPAWQKATSDAAIERAIVGGGAAVGKSPLMPASPNLAGKPEVVAALRTMIRGFAATAR